LKAERIETPKIPFFENPMARAIAFMIGMLIGAGILAMPAVIYQSGFWTGMLVLAFICFAITLMHLYVGEVTLRTKGTHQMAGYVEKYLGKTAKHILTLSMIFMLNGGMVAYIIGEGAALKSIFGGNDFLFSMVFFIIMTIIIFFSLRVIVNSELAIGLAMVTTILIICGISAFNINFNNFQGFDVTKFFIPYGIIFFSIVGGSAVPVMKEELKKNKKALKTAIIWATLGTMAVYALFSIVVIGVVGDTFNNLEHGVATVALGMVLGKYMNIFGNLFAVLSMATSFIAMATVMKWVYRYDYKMNKHLAWLVTCMIPIIIVLLNVTTFLRVLALIGAIGGGIEGIMIVLMHRKAKKMGERKPEYSIPNNIFISSLLILVFIIGLIVTLVI